MKYKIVISEGCVASGITFNDRDWHGEYEPTLMSESEKDEAVEYLLEKVREGLKDGSVLIHHLIELFCPDDTEYGETCDQCGDSVTTRTWEL